MTRITPETARLAHMARLAAIPDPDVRRLARDVARETYLAGVESGSERATAALLTADEHRAMQLLADVANLLGTSIVANGPSRRGDLNEAAIRCHDLQHMIMAQAAARAYPDRYRLLGQTVQAGPPRPVSEPTPAEPAPSAQPATPDAVRAADASFAPALAAWRRDAGTTLGKSDAALAAGLSSPALVRPQIENEELRVQLNAIIGGKETATVIADLAAEITRLRRRVNERAETFSEMTKLHDGLVSRGIGKPGDHHVDVALAEIDQLRRQVAADPYEGFRDALAATIALLWPYGKPPRVPHFYAGQLPQAVEWLLDQRLTLMAALDQTDAEMGRLREEIGRLRVFERQVAELRAALPTAGWQLSPEHEPALIVKWLAAYRADLERMVSDQQVAQQELVSMRFRLSEQAQAAVDAALECQKMRRQLRNLAGVLDVRKGDLERGGGDVPRSFGRELDGYRQRILEIAAGETTVDGEQS